jgi:hypothetical protein
MSPPEEVDEKAGVSVRGEVEPQEMGNVMPGVRGESTLGVHFGLK